VLSVKLCICAVGQSCLSSSGSVILVCAIGKSRSSCGYVLSVTMWVYAIGLPVGEAVHLCYRLCCGFVLSVNLLVRLWYRAVGQSV